MITKILVRPYRYKPSTWEADVTLLIQGHEVRRRWKSPMPSRLASERWAREKALGFLADGPRTRRTEQQKGSPGPEKTELPTFAIFAERWMEQYVVANGLRDSTAANYRQDLDAHLLPLLGDLRLDQIDVVAVQRLKAARADRLAASTINKVLGRSDASTTSGQVETGATESSTGGEISDRPADMDNDAGQPGRRRCGQDEHVGERCGWEQL